MITVNIAFGGALSFFPILTFRRQSTIVLCLVSRRSMEKSKPIVTTLLQRIFLRKEDHMGSTHLFPFSFLFTHTLPSKALDACCSESGHKSKVFAKEIFIIMPLCRYFRLASSMPAAAQLPCVACDVHTFNVLPFYYHLSLSRVVGSLTTFAIAHCACHKLFGNFEARFVDINGWHKPREQQMWQYFVKLLCTHHCFNSTGPA